MSKAITAIFALITSAVLLAACNTFEGAGKDLKGAANAVDKRIDAKTKSDNRNYPESKY